MKKLLSLMLLCMVCMGAWAETYKITSVGSPIDLSTLEVGKETPVLMYAGGDGAYGFVSYTDASGARFTIDQTNHANVVGLASLPYEYGITKLQNGDVISYRVRTYTASNKYLPGWPSSASGNYSAGTIGASGYVTDFVATENSTTSNVLSGGNVYTFTANTTNGITVQKGSGIFTIPSTTNTVPLQFCTYTKQKITVLISGTDELPIKFSTDTESYDYYIKCNNGGKYLNPFTFPANSDAERGVFRFYESSTSAQYLLYEVGSGKWFTYSQTDNNILRLIAVEDKAKAKNFVVKYVSGTDAPYYICPSANQNTSFNWYGGLNSAGYPYTIGTNPATNTIGFYNSSTGDQNSKWLIEAVAEAEVNTAELAATKAAALAEIDSRKVISALYAEADATTAVAAVNAAADIAAVNTAMDIFYRSAEGKYFKFSNSNRSSEKRYVTQTAADENGIGTTTAESPNNVFSLEYANNGLYYVKSYAIAEGYWKNLDVRNGRLKATNSKANAGLWNLRTATQNSTDSKTTHTVLFNSNSTTGWYYMHNSTSAYVVDWVYSNSDASYWTVEEVGYDITLNYTSENNSWSVTKFVQSEDEVTSSSVAVDFYKNFVIASTTGHTYNVTCKEDFPFTVGQPTRIQNTAHSDRMDFYVDGSDVKYLTGTAIAANNSNLWYFEHASATDPYLFTVKNLGTSKYLTFENGSRTAGTAQTEIKGSATEFADQTSYVYIRKGNGGFCIQHPKYPQTCYSTHITESSKVGGWAAGNETAALDNADNALKVLSPESFTANLAATDGTDHYASIYLPYTMTLPEGVEAYAAAQDGEVLKLTKVGEAGAVIPEGAYILYSASESSVTLALGAAATVSAGTNALTGKFEVNVDLPTGSNYVLNDKNNVVGFYKYSNTTYPVAKAVFSAGESSAISAFRFEFDQEEQTTGVEQMIQEITLQGEVFDLAGRRLNKVQKGINIINGRKVLR